MPVGPGDAELERCRDTVASLEAHEPRARWVILVDDGTKDRRLDGAITARAEATVIAHPLRGARAVLEDRVAAGVLAGIAHAVRRTPADVIMKLDTDALVIAGFADKLAGAFRDPSVGLVGSYDRTCNGQARDFSPWVERVRGATRRVRLGRRPRLAVAGRRARARRYIAEARRSGYAWGEHVLACALALPAPLVRGWDAEGVLDDPCLFAGTGLFDDPILTILVRRSGRRPAGLVDDGDVFAVARRGLPGSPERLRDRGYSVIHSVKNDPSYAEDEIRGFFRGLRGGGA